MRHAVLSIVAATVLLAACGSAAEAPVAQPVSTSPTSMPSTSTTSPTSEPTTEEPTPTTSTPLPPPSKDQLFLAEYEKAFGYDSEIGPDYYVTKAQETCQQIGQYKGDEAARYILESTDSMYLNEMPLYAKYYCPTLLPVIKRAATGFTDGDYEIGKPDGLGQVVRPGTYRTEPGVRDCYWERVTGSGGTIANDFITHAPRGVTVTIRKTDGGFSTEGCGVWLPVQ